MTSGASAQGHLGHLARGGALGLVGALFSALSGFLLVVVVTRGLDPQDAGLFFSTTAAFLMIAAMASLGTEAGLARFLLRLEADGQTAGIQRVIRSARLTVLVAALVAGGLLVAFADPVSRILGWDRAAPSLPWLLALALPLAVLSDFALSGTRAFARMRPTVVVDRVLRSGAQAVLGLVVIALGGGLITLTAAWLAPYAVAAVLGIVALRHLTRARIDSVDSVARTAPGGRSEPALHVVRDFWRFTWPRGLTRLAQIGIQKSDIVLVAAMLSLRDAAVYTAATRFVALGQFSTQALQQALQPRFTAILVHEDRETLREVYRVATAWNVLLTWPVYLVIGCAPAAYLAVFGDQYAASEDAALVVVVMMAAMLLAVASGPVDTLLLMAGRSGRSLANASTALVVDLTLCLVLLPRMGILGAAIAWAAAVLTRCSLAFVQVRSELGVVPTGRAFTVAASVCLGAVGVPIALASLLGLRDPATWVLLGCLCALADLGLLWMLRGLLRVDLLVAALRTPDVRRLTASLSRSSGGHMHARSVSGRLRTVLPTPAVRAVRAAVVSWGKVTAPWRMAPGFVIVGAQRSGTTTLFRLLSDHPHVVRPTLSKGTGYFDDYYGRGERWYRAHFPLRGLSVRDVARVTFECSGYYMFHPHAPSRMARDLPDVRVVAVVRDPVERAYSAHQHELARGFESLPFDAAVELESARTDAEARRLEDDEGHVSFAHRHHSYLGRGEYDVQIARLHAAFGPDRVFVVEADSFFADPIREFTRLQQWLGLPVWIPDEVPHWNARSRSPMEPALRERLRAHFEPHDEALAQLLGHVPAWRTTEPSR